MDFLKAAIEAKEKSLGKKRKWSQALASAPGDEQDQKTQTGGSQNSDPSLESGAPRPKYLRRGDLRELEEEERERRRRERRLAARASSSSSASAMDRNSVSSSMKPSQTDTGDTVAGGQRDGTSSTHGQKKPQPSLSAGEVKRRLRGMGEPITLFGETDPDRLRRLMNVELDTVERHTGITAGKRNIFQDILVQDVERDIEAAVLGAYDDDPSGRNGGDGDGDDGDGEDRDDDGEGGREGSGGGGGSLEERVRKERARRERNTNRYSEDRDLESFRGDVERYVMFWLKRMLWLWELELLNRPEEERRTPQGRMASAQQKQTREYIKPLFRRLRRKTCEPDVLAAIHRIVDRCREREYVLANREYLLLSIGDAPWPMGVTMVGIHERSGREKISAHNTAAHILDDQESQRYIHAVKRLMTFCQNKYPSVPSKMVQ